VGEFYFSEASSVTIGREERRDDTFETEVLGVALRKNTKGKGLKDDAVNEDDAAYNVVLESLSGFGAFL
jgi:hypothetical protein